jgi:hypothetical protein
VVVRERIDAMSREERREFTRLMFTLLEATGAKTLTELHRGGPKTARSLIKAFRELSAEDQETASYLWDKLVGNRSVEVKLPLPAQANTAAPILKKRRAPIRISFFPLLLP